MTGFDIELPPVIRVTHEDMQDPEVAPRVAEFREAFPHGEVVISGDATCPHCAAQDIRVDEHGDIRDTATGEVVSAALGAYLTYGPGPGRRAAASRKSACKRQRASRRQNC